VLTGSGAIVLDDIDKSNPSEHVRNQLFPAIDQRVEAGAPMIVTANSSIGQLGERLGEAIMSRLAGHCTPLELDGPDRRLSLLRGSDVTTMAVHGHRGGDRTGKRSPTYHSWQSMIARCTRPTHPRFEDYGGRGIQVDPRWRGKGGFERFLEDMGERPEGMTLDRIDVNDHYRPGNCRWADKFTQRWNRRDMAERSEPRSDKVEPLFEDGVAYSHQIIRFGEEDEIPF
jgi:hypothetical protein